VTPPPVPLPADLQRRLDTLTAKPLLRRAPLLVQAIATLIRDAAGRRGPVIQAALSLAERHRPVNLDGIQECVRCAQDRPHWPCREAVIAAEILHALGHKPPYKLPWAGGPAYSPEPSAEGEGAGGPANSYNQAPDWVSGPRAQVSGRGAP
jgi:hypothetical protein